VETQESRPVDTGGSLEVIAATTGSVADRDDVPRASAIARGALGDYARDVASRTPADMPAAEALEVLRAWLHLLVDETVDGEALRHPSADRLIVRMPRYADLIHDGADPQ
jgi:hypothetical protein